MITVMHTMIYYSIVDVYAEIMLLGFKNSMTL